MKPNAIKPWLKDAIEGEIYRSVLALSNSHESSIRAHEHINEPVKLSIHLDAAEKELAKALGFVQQAKRAIEDPNSFRATHRGDGGYEKLMALGTPQKERP